MQLTDAPIAYLASQRLGRLATTGVDGKPPVGDAFVLIHPEQVNAFGID